MKSKKVLIRLKAITKGKHWDKWFDDTYYHCNITNYETTNKIYMGHVANNIGFIYRDTCHGRTSNVS